MNYDETVIETNKAAHSACWALLRGDILEAKRLAELFLNLIDEEDQAWHGPRRNALMLPPGGSNNGK